MLVCYIYLSTYFQTHIKMRWMCKSYFCNDFVAFSILRMARSITLIDSSSLNHNTSSCAKLVNKSWPPTSDLTIVINGRMNGRKNILFFIWLLWYLCLILLSRGAICHMINLLSKEIFTCCTARPLQYIIRVTWQCRACKQSMRSEYRENGISLVLNPLKYDFELGIALACPTVVLEDDNLHKLKMKKKTYVVKQ